MPLNIHFILILLPIFAEDPACHDMESHQSNIPLNVCMFYSHSPAVSINMYLSAKGLFLCVLYLIFYYLGSFFPGCLVYCPDEECNK